MASVQGTDLLSPEPRTRTPLRPLQYIMEALTEALDDVAQGRRLSAAVMCIPTLSSAGRSVVVKKAALLLYPHKGLRYPPSDSTSKDPEQLKTWSYIQYGKALSSVRQAYQEQRWIRKEQEHEDRYIADAFHRSRLLGQEALWHQLRDSPAGPPVLEPRAMEVDVGPEDDFKPFFCHMKSQAPPPEDQVEFKRGVFYADGRIDLCKQVVGPAWIGQLMESITQNEAVKHFLLGNNIIDLQGAQVISAFLLNSLAQIETWYLAGNRIDHVGIRFIAQALQKDQFAQALWLKRNPLMPQGAVHIAELVKHNKHLKLLDLDNTGLMNQGVVTLFQGLKHNRTLELLYLDANNIGLEGITAIAEYFEYKKRTKEPGLHSLFMGMNPLKDEGVIKLAESLQGYKSLQRLTLSSVRMTDSGLAFLLDSLSSCPDLMMLDTGHYKSSADMHEISNNVGTKGAEALARFIRMNQSVQVLDLRTMHLDLEGLQLIRDAILENKTLLYVYPEQQGLRGPESRAVLRDIRQACDRNCKRNRGMDLQEFCTNHLRKLKHTDRVVHVDSIYRNAAM